jgi:pSer/pThr/pTyr-binding forkhead associated (FHA) protein
MANQPEFTLRALSEQGHPLPNIEPFPVDRPIFVGAEGDNELVLPRGKGDGQPSRRHALLSPEGGRVWLEDLGSLNGTFVNGSSVQKGKRVELKAGDQVRFGKHQVWQFNQKADGPKWVSPEDRERGGSETDVFDQAEDATPASDPTPGPFVPVISPTLEIITGSRAGERLTLQDNADGTGEWAIGSAPTGNFLMLSDDGVSQLHARILHQQRRWAVEDSLSKNGTFVNRERTLLSFLRSGDEIRFGSVRCVFRLPGKE